MKKYVLIISGATATGKSDFSYKVAQELGGEIINADIGSLYTPLTIGTAKPDWRSMNISHHLFDVLDNPVNFSVMQFRARVLELIGQIWERGHVPIIVGGSAFYIKSLFFKQHDIPDTDAWVHELEQRKDLPTVLWQELYQIDPDRASQIHKHDRYRLIRAIAIFKATGQKPSKFAQIFEPIAPFFFITCVRDRQELYQRINGRVGEMMDAGWLQEVRSLQSTNWEEFLHKKKLIGYDDLLTWLSDSKSEHILNDIVAIIAQKTRHYAKRQIIFLNKLQTDVSIALQNGHYLGAVEEINLTLCDVGLYIKGLSNRILQTDYPIIK